MDANGTAVPISSSCRRVGQEVFTHRGLCTSLNSAFLRVQGCRLLVCTARHYGRSWNWAPVLSVPTCFSPFMCPKAVKCEHQECLYQNTDSVWLVWLWTKPLHIIGPFSYHIHKLMGAIHKLRSILYVFPSLFAGWGALPWVKRHIWGCAVV